MNIGGIRDLAELLDKYGFLIIFAIVSGGLNFFFVVRVVTGSLIPRRLYDSIEHDRDRMQAIMDKDREKFMEPVMGVLSRLKKDDQRPEGGTGT